MPLQSGEKLNAVGTQALSRRGEGEEADQRAGELNLAEFWTARSQQRFSWEGSSGAHFCPEKAVLAGARSPRQSGKKMETNWKVAGTIQGREDVP